MAFKVLFYDAVNGSPSYNSDDFANYFKQFSSDGILGSTGGECAVTAVSGSRKVKIAKGCILMDGRQVIIDDHGVELTVPQNTITNYVVLEQTITTGMIEPKIVQSVTASGKKYIQLATVQTSMESANILNSNIMDKRVFAEFNLKNQKSLSKKIVYMPSVDYVNSDTKAECIKIAKPAINHNYVKAHIELTCNSFPRYTTGCNGFCTDVILDKTGDRFGYVSEWVEPEEYNMLGTRVSYFSTQNEYMDCLFAKSISSISPGSANISIYYNNSTISIDIYLEEEGEYYVIKAKRNLNDDYNPISPIRGYQISATFEFE